jgi:hypothetical protein
MDLEKILAELRQQRDQLDMAILSLERLARSRGPRRGRPPAWMSEMSKKRRGRPPGSKNRKAEVHELFERGQAIVREIVSQACSAPVPPATVEPADAAATLEK